jgi:glycosyltransferase involved in cell wall biosynthesis
MVSTVRAQRYWLSAWRAIRQLVRRSDALLVRWPFQLPLHAMGLAKPKVLHVVADVAAVVGASRQRGPIGTLAARAFAGIMETTARRIAHEPRTRTVTNGSRLLTLLGAQERGRAVVSSSLWASEIPPVDLRPLHDPPRLLFVGYTRPEKGIDLLLDAVATIAPSRPVELTLAGGDDRAGARSIMDGIALPSNVCAVGAVPFGEPLFDLFRTHDAVVVPSRSEGTPRVLIEARAFSCPVIATDVGGIPDSVIDGETGLLVPPNDPNRLASAIMRLLDDDGLRRRLIAAGHAVASRCTVESYADAILGELAIAKEGSP